MEQKYEMLGYIYDNGGSLQRTLDANESEINKTIEMIRTEGIKQIVITGIGSSYTAAMMAAPLLRYHSIYPVHIIPSTELGYYANQLINDKTLVISISRSGEREWVVNGLKLAVECGAKGIAMTGVADSLMSQAADVTWETREGPESAFPKTKSVIACCGLLMRFALALADPKDKLAEKRLAELRKLPEVIADTVKSLDKPVQNMIPSIMEQNILLATGTGSNYGSALEICVKVQETSLVASLCDDTGNLLHGPMGALNRNWLVLQFVHSADAKLQLEFLNLIKIFNANTVCITEPGINMDGQAEHLLQLPQKVDFMLASLVYLPVAQMINYYWAIAQGYNPDHPDAMNAILDAILPSGRSEPDLV